MRGRRGTQINEKGISQRLSVFCSRIISICMFRLPAFGDEVVNLLWDPAMLLPLHHGSPQTPTIQISQDFAGSTCSLFTRPSDADSRGAEHASPPCEHTSPATIGRRGAAR